MYEVKITALKAIFDILLVYGFKLLESVVATEDEAQNQNNPAEDMINVFFDLLDGKVSALYQNVP